MAIIYFKAIYVGRQRIIKPLSVSISLCIDEEAEEEIGFDPTDTFQ